MDVGHKVGHLVVRQVEAMELGKQVGTQPSELLLVGHGDAPAQREHVLDLLQLEHEREDLVVIGHDFWGEDRGQRRQV